MKGGLGPVVVVSCAMVGCTLPSATPPKPISFQLPTQTFTFDTSTWTNLPATLPPPTSCMTAQDCCNFPGCESAILVCETIVVAGQPPTPGGCSVQFPESLATTIDLAMVPELQPYQGQLLSGPLLIDNIAYSLSGNTMNDPFGSVSILYAPPGVTSPNDGRDQEIGVVPLVFSDTDPSGTASLETTSISGVNGFSSTFHLIASTIQVLGGLPLPSGQITLSITISASSAVLE